MDLLILIGAIIITYLVFNWLIKVIKASFNTAISIALLVLFLQLFFGIEPEKLWQQLIDLPDAVRSFVTNFRSSF